MKLKIKTRNIDSLRSTLQALSPLRKYCVLRFTPTYMNVISASLSEPQVWCRLSSSLFDEYEVESVRENVISFEINIEPLFMVLRNYDKSNSDGLSIRLQKKVDSSDGANGDSQRSALLALLYGDVNSSTNIVNHTFRIPVRLLKKESDQRITEPELSNVDVLMKLPTDINCLFKRVERYKKSEKMVITGARNGYLGLSIGEEGLQVTMSWNERLQVQQSDGESERSKDQKISVAVRLKDWRLGCRVVEVCKNVVLIISENEAIVLHCYLDDSNDCEIVYYISGVRDD